MTNDIPAGTHVLHTRIPEGHAVQGLEYGRSVATPGWSGYYTQPADTDLPMAVARRPQPTSYRTAMPIPTRSATAVTW